MYSLPLFPHESTPCPTYFLALPQYIRRVTKVQKVTAIVNDIILIDALL